MAIRHGHGPIPHTPSRLDARAIDSVREGLQRELQATFPREEITRALYVPTYRAPVAEALAGDDGTLWLRWESATSPDLYSVLGVDGRILAHMHASSRVRLRWCPGLRHGAKNEMRTTCPHSCATV